MTCAEARSERWGPSGLVDVRGLGTLGALHHLETNPLFLRQGAEALGLHGGVVDEDADASFVTITAQKPIKMDGWKGFQNRVWRVTKTQTAVSPRLRGRWW